MEQKATDNDVDYYRREAVGAFAHEIRTPLTSLRMVIELARRQSRADGDLVIDGELASMLDESIAGLQRLADDLQEQSRLERGRVTAGTGPCDLRAALAAAAEMVGPRITFAGEEADEIEGPWDAGKLVRALAGFAESANRIGDGSGTVRVRTSVQPTSLLIEFSSGEPSGEERPVAADAGFSFFWGRQYILAAGGSVHVLRRERFCSYTITLPLAEASP